MIFSIFIICALLGAVAGFFSGLLGIGGGLIIVPALAYLLPLQGISDEVIMQLALATSLATIVLTSGVAMLAHHKNGNIPWEMALRTMALVAAGAVTGAIFADLLSSKVLARVFSVGVSLLAAYMFFSIKRGSSRAMPGPLVWGGLAYATGIISSMMGIGGGAILVPLLTYFSLSIRFAIGIASACSMTVAFAGSLGYVFSGLDNPHLPPWSLGYVYLPALIAIISTSVLTAPLGVKFASRLPVTSLKKIFAIFLLVIALEMMLS
jgi:uncharacterized membrane protein YfcA